MSITNPNLLSMWLKYTKQAAKMNDTTLAGNKHKELTGEEKGN
jgi:hypothetical protein